MAVHAEHPEIDAMAGEMKKAAKSHMTFTDLTWEDLREWAGSRVVARGKSYRSAVEDLRLTADGRLLAWVDGSDRYATVVTIGKAGRLSSTCTCPYAIACKHAVAMVLAYLDAVQAGQSIPGAAADDERLDRLANARDEDEVGAEPAPALPKRPRKPGPSEDPDAAIHRYLEALAPAALLDFVRELAGDFPDVRQRIADRAELQSGDVAKLLANTRREIASVSADPGWSRHWSNERHIPDYSRVQERLESLLASGHADEVVALGDEILELGIQQVGMSHDEGETGREIADCMKIVFRALKASSMTVPERLLWEIDARMRDDYSILDGVEGSLADGSSGTPADWSAVADNLAHRLDALPSSAAKDDTHGSDRDYRRQALMRRLLDALKRAGREPEITAILTREADIASCYVELVDHLRSGKQKEDAEEWARKGFAKTIGNLPGIAWALEERLRDLASRKKDMPLVAAFRAMEFIDGPDVDRYAKVQEATVPLGLWDIVRPMLLDWLETGSRPDRAPIEEPVRRGRARGARPETTRKCAWPLPSTGLSVPGETGRYRYFPDTATLIAIAIREGRNDDVLRLYERAEKRGGYSEAYQGEAVADAVQETHPDAALAIWLRLARAEIAMTKPAAYQTAGMRLTKMKTVYRRTGRLPEWERLLGMLRTENVRRPRMIEVLDGLEGKRSRILKP
jgi:uncharacterized Zn finger protein